MAMRRRGPLTAPEASKKDLVHAQERGAFKKGPHSGHHWRLLQVGVEKAQAKDQKVRMRNRIASTIILACGLCVLSLMLFGGNDPGRTYFSQLGQSWLGDKKGGVNLIFMAFPILVAGSTATLCATTNSPSSSHPRTTPGRTVHWIQRWRYRVLQGSSASSMGGGDWNITALAVTFIFIPSMVYLSMVNYRHFHETQRGLDDQLMDIGNSFGIMAEVVGSFLLIPVSKHSSLLKYFGWSPARAVPLHIWSGRIFVIGGVVHGVFHILRWKVLAGESIISMLIPPAPCWTMDNKQYSSFEPSCVDIDTDCSCYDRFRNLTGYLSGCFMLVIAMTSLHQVRRKFFRIFYFSHIVAAPLALIMLVFHWNRSILYLCPSLLYYAANSLTVMVESRTQCTHHNGVKVVALERIPSLSPQESHYISLTLEATNVAIQRFRPGYYVRLKSPDVSFISHPFTINIVPGESNQMRILFKTMGQFTTKLSQQMQNAIPDQQSDLTSAIDIMPKIYLDGYHGSPNRVSDVLQHENVLIICGGIGITPYLSLLLQVHAILVQGDGMLPTKQVVLVWMCREQSLIDYVKREYLDSLLNFSNNGHPVDFKFQFVVYHTAGDDKLSSLTSYSDGEEAALAAEKGSSPVLTNRMEVLSMGTPFTPSRFAVGSNLDWKANIQAFGAFSLISWGGLLCTWYLYKNHTDKQQVASRGWALVAIGIIGWSVAFFANILASRSYFSDDNYYFSEKDSNDGCIPLKANSEGLDGLVRSSSPNAVELDDLHPTGEPLQYTHHDESETSSVFDHGGSSRIVALKEKRGRPTVHQMLKYVDKSQCPGVFTCGPVGLMKDVREHIIELRRATLEGIALYEEAFEL